MRLSLQSIERHLGARQQLRTITISAAPKVLEIGGHAAAYAGRLWAKTGADVLQVHRPHSTPAWVSDDALSEFNDRGKRRVVVQPGEELEELASRADIVIAEGRTADELIDLGFNSWRCPTKLAMSPFGLTGPKRNWRASPNVILAMAGYTNMTGEPDREPLTVPGHYVEFQTGALGFGATSAAHFASSNDTIDLGMLEVIAALHHYTTVRYHADGVVRQRRGSDFWFVVPSDLFRCRDGWVYVTITPAFWEMFVLLLDAPELTLDERFANNDLRMVNRAPLKELIAASFAEMSCAEVEEKAVQFRVPLGIALTPAEVLEDAHLHARDFWELSNDPSPLQIPGLPWRGQASQVANSPAPQTCDWREAW